MSGFILDFSHLTAAERIQLAEQLWDSLEPHERGALAPDEAQRAELRRRRAALEADGDPGEPWEAVLGEVGRRGG